jgi:hypothetical protein
LQKFREQQQRTTATKHSRCSEALSRTRSIRKCTLEGLEEENKNTKKQKSKKGKTKTHEAIIAIIAANENEYV